MKTLILTGSPRKQGHTAHMVEYLTARLDGEVEVLSLDHRTDITPCRDCRYCFTHPACRIQDSMQDIYRKLDEADRILFAAPVYFYNIPGSMKAVLDLYQKADQEALVQDLTPIMRNQLFADRMKKKVIGDLDPSPEDVRRFFNKIPKDSLPEFETEFELATLTITTDPDPKAVEAIINRL